MKWESYWSEYIVGSNKYIYSISTISDLNESTPTVTRKKKKKKETELLTLSLSPTVPPQNSVSLEALGMWTEA